MITQNFDLVKNKLASRGFDTKVLTQIVDLSRERSKMLTSLQKKEADRNVLSKRFGSLSQDDKSQKNQIITKVSQLKKTIETAKEKVAQVELALNNLLATVPNLPEDDVPVGLDESSNKVIKSWAPEQFDFSRSVVAHYELGAEKKLFDFVSSAQMVGARFWTYLDWGARLVRACSNLMLDFHLSSGFRELNLPLIVNEKTMYGSGQLPKFANDLFRISGRNWYLIPTSEVSLVGFYSQQILDLSRPIKLTAYSPCFRAEAGSGGRDTRGLIRGHQFHKVELVTISSPADGPSLFESVVNQVAQLLEKLHLPYRQVLLCTGDLGFAASKTIDFEVWLPSENTYREISSVSLCRDFQARRSLIRGKNADGEKYYAWTINGSGLALDRTVAALIENHQSEGKIKLPAALSAYLGAKEIKLSSKT